MRRLPDDIDARLRAVAHRFAAEAGELRLADVAEASGIPRATLYYHFSGRDELLAYLFRIVLDDNRIAVTEAIAAAETASDRFEAAVIAEVRFLAAEPGTCRSLFTNLGRLGDLTELSAHARRAFQDPVAEVLEDGHADGSFAHLPDIESTVSAIYGAISMTVLHYAIAEPGDTDLERIITAVLALVRPGLER